MFRSLLCIFTAFTCITAQIMNSSGWSVMDNYYTGILYLEDSNHTVSDKINYPGLFKDSVSSVSAGFSSYLNGDSESNPFSFSDLFGWAEKKTGAGTFGIWLGNIDIGSSKTNNNSNDIQNYEDKNSSARGALWFSPSKGSHFKGVSLNINGDYRLDKTETNQSEYYYNSNYRSEEKNIEQFINMECISLFNLGKDNFLRLGLLNESSKDYEKNLEEYPYYYQNSNESSEYEGKYIYDRFSIGYFNGKGRQLNVAMCADVFNVEHSSYESIRKGNGDLSFCIDYSDGKLLKYLKHRAYLGLNACICGTFPAYSYDDKIFLKDLVHEIKKNNWRMYEDITTPVILDINLFNSSIYAVFKITPEMYASQDKTSDDYYDVYSHSKHRSVSVNLSEIALGLKGKIGNQLEFTLIPSIQSKIFVTGFELKYLFDSKR